MIITGYMHISGRHELYPHILINPLNTNEGYITLHFFLNQPK